MPPIELLFAVAATVAILLAFHEIGRLERRIAQLERER